MAWNIISHFPLNTCCFNKTDFRIELFSCKYTRRFVAGVVSETAQSLHSMCQIPYPLSIIPCLRGMPLQRFRPSPRPCVTFRFYSG
jgi:hypothetical protein